MGRCPDSSGSLGLSIFQAFVECAVLFWLIDRIKKKKISTDLKIHMKSIWIGKFAFWLTRIVEGEIYVHRDVFQLTGLTIHKLYFAQLRCQILRFWNLCAAHLSWWCVRQFGASLSVIYIFSLFEFWRVQQSKLYGMIRLCFYFLDIRSQFQIHDREFQKLNWNLWDWNKMWTSS